MKKIRLTQGQFAIVDDEDFDWLNQWKWYQTSTGYAMRTSIESNGQRWLMHRIIMGLDANQDIDHIDGNRLNNQRENLRGCTKAQNTTNSKKRSGTSSKFKGVVWHISKKKWSVKITRNKIQYHGGDFDSEILAARRYDKLSREFHGEFSKTNEDLFGKYWKS